MGGCLGSSGTIACNLGTDIGIVPVQNSIRKPGLASEFLQRRSTTVASLFRHSAAAACKWRILSRLLRPTSTFKSTPPFAFFQSAREATERPGGPEAHPPHSQARATPAPGHVGAFVFFVFVWMAGCLCMVQGASRLASPARDSVSTVQRCMRMRVRTHMHAARYIMIEGICMPLPGGPRILCPNSDS